jgi:hypothetical protein
MVVNRVKNNGEPKSAHQDLRYQNRYTQTLNDSEQSWITEHAAALQIPNDRTSKRKGTDLSTLCPGHQGLSDVPHTEHRRGLDIIPVLLAEGVDAGWEQRTQAPNKKRISTGLNGWEKGVNEHRIWGRTRRGRRQRNSRFLLASFLPLGDALVLTHRHICLPPATPPLPVLAALGRWRASGAASGVGFSRSRCGAVIYVRGL